MRWNTLADFGPWNPGLQSDLPRAYLPLSTMFRAENVSTSLDEAHELSDFCGLPVHELVAFRPERLVVHELLIRITARFSVPDGSHYGDLGINFRSIATRLLEKHINPKIDELRVALEEVKSGTAEIVTRELDEIFSPAPSLPPKTETKGWWTRFFGSTKKMTPSSIQSPVERERQAIALLQQKARQANAPIDRATLITLHYICEAIMARRGRLLGDRDLYVRLVCTLVGNDLGSATIGRLIEPMVEAGAAAENYTLLPLQDQPVVLNTKGASAAGKSTLRPLQRKLVERLDLNWRDFALISPDIWRKYLLDYDSLGEAFKYAGTLTGHELEIIDKKLDAYMAVRGELNKLPHLLIDRFRFDSFVPGSDEDDTSRLLSRFGDPVYLFFMITPPEATVERAWGRGLEYGRFKAVDDLLDHNIEAFTGMPQLFLNWALKTRKRVHYEFLDNSVPKGTQPRTVAHGWNGQMTILDIKCLIDAERYRKINVEALSPKEVYEDRDLKPQNNTAFIEQCVKFIPSVTFAAFESGKPYLRIEDGAPVWCDPAALKAAMKDEETRAGLEVVLGDRVNDVPDGTPPVDETSDHRKHTLGAWG